MFQFALDLWILKGLMKGKTALDYSHQQKHLRLKIGTVRRQFCRGGSMISRKGVQIYKGVGGLFADFISFFLNIPWKWNNLVSLRPNNFIFIGYLKMGRGEGVWGIPLNPLWIRHCSDRHNIWILDSSAHLHYLNNYMLIVFAFIWRIEKLC